jgi:hypothetical protein
VKHFDLIEEADATAFAENIGKALWTNHPGMVVDLLSDDSSRRQIADRALASLALPTLVQGAAAVPQHRQALFDARPDLGTETAYWSLPDAWSAASLRRAAEHTDIVPATITAMVRSERPSIREACRAFGNENVLRGLVSLLDGNDQALPPGAAKAWLSQACSDPDIVARCLCDESIARAPVLDSLARVVAPDFVPNDFGDDPWLIALRRIAGSEVTPYLASFLLARAFGRRTRNCADLIQLCFDKVYSAAERSMLPDEAWYILDSRLHRSYFWPNWDRCERIRQTTVDLFVNRKLNPRSFVSITARDDIFALMVEIAASSYSGQRYLKSVRDSLSDDGDQRERLRLVKRALW